MERSGTRWLAVGAVGAVLLGLLALVLFRPDAASRRGAAPPPGPGAAVAGAPPAAPPASDGFLGVVLAREAVELSAPFDGRLARVEVQAGARVHAGAELASLDLAALRSEEAMGQALLAGAQAEEERASLEASEASERLERYLKPAAGTFSAEEISTARYQEKAAAARLVAARARTQERRVALARVRQQLSEGVLRAPFEGIVATRYLDPGARVQAGTPIVRLIRAGELRVRFAVPEKRSREIAPGLPVRIALPDVGWVATGKIESISPEIDAASRMVFSTATLGAPGGADGGPSVSAGMVARVALDEAVTPPATRHGG